jgi:predicted ATPase with chaperone activity
VLGTCGTLSHNGVLFLDEVGEFEPLVLDNLRQPLEEGVIRVARAAAKVTLLGICHRLSAVYAVTSVFVSRS